MQQQPTRHSTHLPTYLLATRGLCLSLRFCYTRFHGNTPPGDPLLAHGSTACTFQPPRTAISSPQANRQPRQGATHFTTLYPSMFRTAPALRHTSAVIERSCCKQHTAHERATRRSPTRAAGSVHRARQVHHAAVATLGLRMHASLRHRPHTLDKLQCKKCNHATAAMLI